ncbi:MAG TPA: glycosyltransferase [Pyrinomonadaceae bacterium]|nr:glycosyltransferase [Pyrinomonadaceae bacterium]
MPDKDSLIWKLDQDLSAPFAVGRGGALYLSGSCYHARRRIKRLSVVAGGHAHAVVNHSLGSPELFSGQPAHGDAGGRSLTGGFWTTLAFDEINEPSRVELSLRAVLDDGESCQSPIGTLSLVPAAERQAIDYSPNVPPSEVEPLVAVCMATHNPPPDLFASQVESLINQTHRNWVCIINDDCSTEDAWQRVREVAARDARFRVRRNAFRLGFYHNFGRCLELVPKEADFVALADQDDYWYPHKLEKCLAAFGPGTQMVFSDMEVAGRGGEIISETFWATRRNNYTDLGALVHANTVTGASIVFRANLLDELLPLPELPGDSYHDHWIACVALTKGEIGYVPEPLYAWRQHEGNACGFAATQPRAIEKWMELKTFLYLLLLFLRRSTDFGTPLKCLREQYRSYFVNPVVLARQLLLRVREAPADKKAVLERFLKYERSLPRLAAHACRSKTASLGRELTCFRVALSMRLLSVYCRLARGLFCRRRSDVQAATPAPNASRGNS